MCWQMSVVSPWSRSSVSLTRSWRQLTKALETWSTTWGCLMNASTAAPTRTSVWPSWPTPPTWRLSIPSCRERRRLSSITGETRRGRRLVSHIGLLCECTHQWLCVLFLLFPHTSGEKIALILNIGFCFLSVFVALSPLAVLSPATVSTTVVSFSIPLQIAAVSKLRQFRSPPHLHVSFRRDTNRLLSRGSKRSHTRGKCVTCSGLTNSREGNKLWKSMTIMVSCLTGGHQMESHLLSWLWEQD